MLRISGCGMNVSEFDYNLPLELIAQMPADKRENSRMMVLLRGQNVIEHRHFYDIIDYLDENDLLVLNDTKVLPARLFGTKETGGKLEVFLLEAIEHSPRHLREREELLSEERT